MSKRLELIEQTAEALKELSTPAILFVYDLIIMLGSGKIPKYYIKKYEREISDNNG